MKEPFLTIVIPVYQVEKYLERCVDSILNQQYQDYEIILVDDGSTDSSPRICDEYAEKFEQVHVVHKENGGMSDARNTGLALARGEYISFIDSDDWLDSSCFTKMMPVLEDRSYDLLCFGRQFVKSESEELQQVIEPEIRSVTGYEAYLEMIDQGWVTGFVTDKIYKVSLFRENNIAFPTGRYYEDLGVLYRILLSSKKVALSNQVFYHYFVDNPDSITASWSEEKIRDMFEFYSDVHHSEIILSKLQESDQHIADAYYVNGLVHVLSSIYKSNSEKKYPQIVADITNELGNYPLTYKDMIKQPNKIKYMLYKLSLLKFAFKLKNILRASR